MPTGKQKETKLFFAVGDEEPYEISGIPSIEMDDFCDTEETDDINPFQMEAEFEFTANGNSLFVSLLRIAMPNNWLKMHGIPMRRRGFLVKERIKKNVHYSRRRNRKNVKRVSA